VVKSEALVYHRSIESPVGALLLAGDGLTLRRLAFLRGTAAVPETGWKADSRGVLDPVCRELDRYFAGRLRAFATRVAPDGTAFQRRVWRALCDIPYGTTTSYGELARTIGAETAVRAVGAANGANPIAIIVPCHRVIGANGSLTGFGGGLHVKRLLLEHEGALLPLG
jgi:methylated-DNA-[protein]-cysteine S-methyltransferase